MQICRGEEKHIPGMIRLLRQVGRVHHIGRPDLFRADAQKYNEEQLRELLKMENHPIFIAEEDDFVLGYGFCMVKTIENDTVLENNRTLYIDDLCVDETCRGEGVGKTLYRHICGYAREQSCNSVTLNVWCCNENAMAFYNALGMKPQKIGMEMRLEDN